MCIHKGEPVRQLPVPHAPTHQAQRECRRCRQETECLDGPQRARTDYPTPQKRKKASKQARKQERKEKKRKEKKRKEKKRNEKKRTDKNPNEKNRKTIQASLQTMASFS